MIQSINKSCLGLLRKLIAYASRDLLDQIVQLSCDASDELGESMPISTLLIELIAKILQEDQNYEAVYVGLSISSDLFRKCSPFILEEFTRLGVSNLISELAVQCAKEADAETPESSLKEMNQIQTVETCMYVIGNNNFEWCLAYTKDFIYIWNEYCALELSCSSNGWFRFLMNRKLYSMYSNGKPEMNTDLPPNDAGQNTPDADGENNNDNESEDSSLQDENRLMFINRLLKVKQQSHGQCCVFNFNNSAQVKLDNWILKSLNENNNNTSGEFEIRNCFSTTQRILFRPGLNGIEFESNKNDQFKFIGLVNQGNF